MPPIVTLTANPAVDKSTEVDQVLAERKLRCERPRRDPGGGVNVARVIVDTSGPALRPAVEEGVFLLEPNARELGDLFPGEKVHRIGLDATAVTTPGTELCRRGDVERIFREMTNGSMDLK